MLSVTFSAHLSSIAQGPVGPPSLTDGSARFDSVRVLIGFPGFAPNVRGSLTISPTTITFADDVRSVSVNRKLVTRISDGDETIETGGLGGKLLRAAIPYGGGYVLGTITQQKVNLLTLEFLDPRGEYHGAVLVLHKEDMVSAMSTLDSSPATYDTPAKAPSPPCRATNTKLNTVRLNLIQSDPDSTLPSEDRVLLYEELIAKLTKDNTISDVYRAGDTDPGAQCAEFRLSVSVQEFKKGNQAVRASIGPLGYFIGNTRLTFHVTATDRDGATLLDRDLKKSEGSDTNSLNVTKLVTRAVVKSLRKSRADLRKSQAIQAS